MALGWKVAVYFLVQQLLIKNLLFNRVPTDSGEESDAEDEHEALKPVKVDIDLGLSAYANARK